MAAEILQNETATKFCSIFRAPLFTRHILVKQILEQEEIIFVLYLSACVLIELTRRTFGTLFQ